MAHDQVKSKDETFINCFMPEYLVFSYAKILFLVSLATFCSSERLIPIYIHILNFNIILTKAILVVIFQLILNHVRKTFKVT